MVQPKLCQQSQHAIRVLTIAQEISEEEKERRKKKGWQRPARAAAFSTYCTPRLASPQYLALRAFLSGLPTGVMAIAMIYTAMA